jgi:hypothetical protein
VKAADQIKKALRKIMPAGAANACCIFRGYAYGVNGANTGWHYTPFGENPVFLGSNIPEALETIQQMRVTRKET